MKLYDYPQCPFGQKVRIVLAEKELAYETVNIDLRKGEQKTPEFLNMNPFGKVPVLVDEDLTVYDSTAINEYLDDEYPHPELRPQDSGARARVRMLEDYADLAFTLPVGMMMAEMRKAEEERDAEQMQRSQQYLRRALSMIDATLGDQEFLLGAFSLADISFAPRMVVLDSLGVELDPEWRALRGWIDRLAARPSIRDLMGLDGWR